MDYFVGDIHGQFTRLQAQLDTFFDPEVDMLYSVGDLVDRGPESYLAIEYLQKPWFKAVMGNHEDMIIKGYTDPGQRWLSEMNGGQWFWQLDKATQDETVWLFKEHLPLNRTIYINNLKIGIVHAEPPDDWDSAHTPDQAMWARDRISYGDKTVVKNVDRVYVGHTPTDFKILGNVYYIDSGAWIVNKLQKRAHDELGVPYPYLPFKFHTVYD